MKYETQMRPQELRTLRTPGLIGLALAVLLGSLLWIISGLMAARADNHPSTPSLSPNKAQVIMVQAEPRLHGGNLRKLSPIWAVVPVTAPAA